MQMKTLSKGIGSLLAVLLMQGCSGGGGNSGSSGAFVTTSLATIQCTAGSSTGPVNNLDCSDTTTGPNVWVSGTVSYDRVRHNPDGSLDYTTIDTLPVRGATVDAIYAGGVQSVATDSSGNYQVCVPKNTNNITIRANAELYRTGTPAWDFTVVDNTQSQALYAMQTTTFNTVSSDISGKNLHALTAWGGISYTSLTGAPFAILDSVYDAMTTVLAECAGAAFPALKINWSVNNVAVEGNPAVGKIGTTAFNGSQIYVLGAEDSDTDEFDDHVIIHEWAHYLEHYFSRSDSIGGPHSDVSVLDIRVAFSEGFSNAYSAIASNDTDYADSNDINQSSGFAFNLEDNNCSSKGWYSECSVQSIVYDLYDTVADAGDGVSLGFGKLFDVLIKEQRYTPALTSIFSFIYELKQNNNLSVSTAIDTLTSNQDIDNITDIYGDSELTNNPGAVDKLPVYETIDFGQRVNICSTAEHQNYNGLGVSRFLRFDLNASKSIRITATRTSGLPYADPDIVLHYKGEVIAVADSDTSNSEVLSGTLNTTGTYIIEVYEYAYLFSGSSTTCFNIQLGSI